MPLNADREQLNKLVSGLRLYADAQPAVRGIVVHRMLDMISALLHSLIDRIEQLEKERQQ